MAIESAKNIVQLDPANPAHNDQVSDARKHINLIKKVLVDILTTSDKAMTLSNAQLSALIATTTRIDAQVKTIEAATVIIDGLIQTLTEKVTSPDPADFGAQPKLPKGIVIHTDQPSAPSGWDMSGDGGSPNLKDTAMIAKVGSHVNTGYFALNTLIKWG